MNDISVFIYLMCFAAVFGMTCVYMFMMMRSTISEFDKRPVKTYGDVMRAYRPPAPHPEMKVCAISLEKIQMQITTLFLNVLRRI